MTTTPRPQPGLALGSLALGVLACLTPASLAQDAPPSPPPAKDKSEAPPAESTPTGPGHDLFVQARDAVNALQSLTYHTRAFAQGGMLESMTPLVEADVQQIKAVGGSLPGWRVRVTGRSTPKSGTPAEFDIAWLTASVEVVDHAARKVIEKPMQDARKNKGYTAATSARLEEFTSLRPFAKELLAADCTIEDRRTIAGTECDVILVTTGRVQTRWCLGATDHLPRRLERIVGGKDGQSLIVQEFSDVGIDRLPASAASNLRVTIPADYTEDRPARPATGPKPEPSPDAAPTTPTATPTDGTQPGEAGSPVAPPTPAAPRRAPAFELTSLTGEKVSLASLAGHVVVLEFAGSWTLSLRDSRPEFEAFVKAHPGDKLRAYSIAVREKSRDNAIAEYRKGSFSFGLLLDGDDAARAFGVTTYPSYALIDSSGLLLVSPGVYTHTDTFASLSRLAEEALAAATPTPAPTPAKPEAPAKPAGG